MADTLDGMGTGTLPLSGPGVISSVTVTDGSAAEASRIQITPTANVEDGEGPFGAYVYSKAAGSFVVRANRAQLPEAMTFDYVLHSP